MKQFNDMNLYSKKAIRGNKAEWACTKGEKQRARYEEESDTGMTTHRPSWAKVVPKIMYC